MIKQVLQIETVDDERPLQDYGLDSIMAMRLSTGLEKRLQRSIQASLLIEFPTVKELSHHLNGAHEKAPF
jgi:acyl carrier protein